MKNNPPAPRRGRGPVFRERESSDSSHLSVSSNTDGEKQDRRFSPEELCDNFVTNGTPTLDVGQIRVSARIAGHWRETISTQIPGPVFPKPPQTAEADGFYPGAPCRKIGYFPQALPKTGSGHRNPDLRRSGASQESAESGLGGFAWRTLSRLDACWRGLWRESETLWISRKGRNARQGRKASLNGGFLIPWRAWLEASLQAGKGGRHPRHGM